MIADVQGDGDALVLAASGFRFTPTGLTVDGSPGYETWALVGRQLQYIEGAVHWWIGDWLNYGERVYGEMYTQALNETPYSPGTLANDKYVAGRIESSRRREVVPFSHHQEVASLPPEQQDAMLDRAETEHLTRRELRQAIRYDSLRAAALIEYKHESASPQLSSNAQYCALVDLGDRANLPVYAVRYARDFAWWLVVPLNEPARALLPTRSKMTELEYVTFLYRLRGRDLPISIVLQLERMSA